MQAAEGRQQQCKLKRAEIEFVYRNMEEDNNKSPEQATFHHGNVNFNRISAVAEEWMLDFLFVSLCRRFKEGKLDEFNGTLQTFQGKILTVTDQQQL